MSAEREYRFARRQSTEEDKNYLKTAVFFDDRTLKRTRRSARMQLDDSELAETLTTTQCEFTCSASMATYRGV